MNATSLEHKTIRPGSLVGYSYYHSAPRRPAVNAAPAVARPARRARGGHRKAMMVVAVLAALIILPLLRSDSPPTGPLQTNPKAPAVVAGAAVVAKKTNYCANNSHAKLVLISVSQRHMWACEGAKAVHDAPIISGMTAQPDTLTPPGTYQIYAKQTNTTLSGSDSTGSWRRPVHFWMPFLDNQYGTYGFHDATWRTDNEFGNVDPAGPTASHGCVELPLASQKWLYDWAPVKTPVTVES